MEGCSPGVRSTSGKKGQGAGLTDEVFLSTAQLKKHFVHAETRRLAGEEECLPAWLMMAARSTAGEGAFAAVATGDLAAGDEVKGGQDSRDAAVLPTWKQKFDVFFDNYAEELRASLPEMSRLRHDGDQATIQLKPDASGPPSKRPYKMSVEELRQPNWF